MKKWLTVSLLSVLLVFSVSATVDVYDFDTPEQEALFHALGKELRCPKCQNNNIADSNAGLAQDLRMKVYEMIKQGKSEKEIVGYMVARYGNFVTYNPPVTRSTFILWAGPALFIFLGFTVLVMRSRRREESSMTTDKRLDTEEEARLTTLLADEHAAESQKDKK
ncbi:cytochrome c-type biogenesis protein CcmH [Veronia nyctiphanis]|uniref:Cytochrome c-type biogenesis protein n=1 Tax=Veronia nyctiphanis TaxID=1278244 RepID=A0A4Q0YS42_9GAMM|nr:cytochrome c-type biogenesis protein [Veronia nyctiphanis]RXJ72944.1 cytochrome c-type biogenesis protein CcmH [Veronia nyctiphanis]